MWTSADVAAARRRLEQANSVLALTHYAPDGDALGSLLGFGLAVRALGKHITLACADPVPDTFRFLPHASLVSPKLNLNADLIVALDAADLGRLGDLAPKLPRQPDLQFDHHITNTGFATINFLDVQAASTAELVADLLEPLGLPTTTEVAQCLLAGLVSDTLGFRTSSTTPKTMHLAQTLVNAGASLQNTIDQALHKRSVGAVRLWALGLANLQLADRVVWATLPLSTRAAAGYNGKGDADLINLLTTVREADVAITLTEREDGKVKVSWRSTPKYNVSLVAQQFGGGGHAAAAGAEIAAPLAEAEQQVLQATRALMQATAARHEA